MKKLGWVFENISSNQFKVIKHHTQSLILIALLIIYFITLVINYRYSNNEFKNRKNEILEEYYQIIFNHSIVKLNETLHKLPSDQTGKNTVIEINQSDIKSCYKNQCIKSNLFEFASVFDKYIPNYIHYKIDINKQVLHRDRKISSYELERSNHINNYNQLSIQVALDPKYLENIHQKAFNPFYITFLSSSFFLALYIVLIRLINTNNEVIYNKKLKEREEVHKNASTEKENELMKRIWNLEYSKEKEVKLNYLFFQEVNKQAMIINEIAGEIFCQKCKILPYSIPLYQNTKDSENINIKDLVEIFTSRFPETNNHILLNIQSSEQNINFSSKAALYQIIYSLVSYIMFILCEQSNNKKYKIKVTIKAVKKALQLYFEYDGFPIIGEQEIIKISDNFYKKHANPFLLNIKQIFGILRDNGFECNIKHDQSNFIEILQTYNENYMNKEDNIILLSSYSKENK